MREACRGFTGCHFISAFTSGLLNFPAGPLFLAAKLLTVPPRELALEGPGALLMLWRVIRLLEPAGVSAAALTGCLTPAARLQMLA